MKKKFLYFIIFYLCLYHIYDLHPLADHMKLNPNCEFLGYDEIYFITSKRSDIYKEKASFESRLGTFLD